MSPNLNNFFILPKMAIKCCSFNKLNFLKDEKAVKNLIELQEYKIGI